MALPTGLDLGNDTRGWIMSCVSGIACVLGSLIICVDVVAPLCLGKRKFQIVENDVFLASSMSLSAGVLLFTSLYSMLPTSRDYLTRAGYSSGIAAFMLIGLFLLGVVGIKVVSGFIHQHIPSHVVACAHSHEENNDHMNNDIHDIECAPGLVNSCSATLEQSTEQTPLLSTPAASDSMASQPQHPSSHEENAQLPKNRVSSVKSFFSRRISGIVGVRKTMCDKNGPCYGLSQACGQECLKISHHKDPEGSIRPTMVQHHSLPTPLPTEGSSLSEATTPSFPIQQFPPDDLGTRSSPSIMFETVSDDALPPTAQNRRVTDTNRPSLNESSTALPHQAKNHHHHVPQNAFLSIGLQTSLAIALHKLPEGFITYATNHTNPTLGWSVFVALSVHNITEGFAMALPLFLALRSRLRAVFWSSLLGGVSQPAGAGLAALWIWGVQRSNARDRGDTDDPDGVSWAVYGGMFAATAGVMTNVALQLFSEGLVLSHNQNLCIGFAIAGMGILGLSFALTA
ncbi:Zinc transporter [Ophidiomyces ophidiicola]|nr:Zinc transporter [Ophidiomyces ophidiicola]